MADDSELDYLKTFVDEATTGLTVATYETVRRATKIAGIKKCLIEPGETLSTDGAFYKKRFKLKLIVATEAIMTAIINEIIDGCIVYSKRGAGYTFPATMCHVKFVYTNKTFKEGELWKNDVYLDVEWCTS